MSDLKSTARQSKRRFDSAALMFALLPILCGLARAAVAETGVVSIAVVPRLQMTAGDRRVVESNQAAIGRSAEIYGYSLDSSYDYKEIACPLTPNHLLLAYESVQPNGASSRFTAVIPRTPARAGGVQIISISHFGSIPFLPAGSNPHTVEVFNRVVSAASVAQAVSDDPGNNPLLFNSLCFLGMIGEPPAALTAPSLNPATIYAQVPTMKFREKGNVTQVVSVKSSSASYQVWSFTFGRDGRLLSAEKVDHPIDVTPPIVNARATSTTVPPMVAAQAGAVPAAAAPPPPFANPAPPPAAPTSASAAEQPAAAIAPAISTPAAADKGVASTTIAAEAAAASSTAAAASATVAIQKPPAPAAHASSAKTQVAAKIVPLPPERLITNLPLPPSRMIPDGSLPYPPHAPAK